MVSIAFEVVFDMEMRRLYFSLDLEKQLSKAKSPHRPVCLVRKELLLISLRLYLAESCPEHFFVFSPTKLKAKSC